MEQIKVGQQLHGYTLKRVDEIPELLAKAYFLVHDKSQAQHLHLWRDDNNNEFSITFRTPPSNDTGVPHVLEHLVTMGSQNYPCRELYMKMAARSLATNMNAFTESDHTCYHFSTTNRKDMENLTKVYLDFVFNPTLKEIDFRQEAWRLEHAKVKNKKSPLKFKGVVLNEMKGEYSNNSSLYYKLVLESIFPDNAYSFDYGGDPLHIPRLSHEEMKQFYDDYYHPSNSRFFTYGNMPVENHLKLINNLILSKYDQDVEASKFSKIPHQKFWTAPKEIRTKCRPDPMAPFPDKQTTVSLSFLVCDLIDSFETFTMSLISDLLTSGPNAPFYESLIRSNLGMDYASGTGYWDSTKQTIFSVGLQGVHEKEAEKVKEIIMKTFQDVVETGFPQERIDALLHSIELSLKNQPANFGHHLMTAVQSTWNHDGDPVSVLRINQKIERFKKELETNPNFLKEKVKKYFLENTHCLFFIMSAAEDYLKEYKAKEKALLSEKTDELTPEDREKIYQQGLELRDYLNANSDASCLPCLKVNEDIPRNPIKTNLSISKITNIPVQVSPQPTNTVIYLRMILPFAEKDIPNDLKPYWPIFCDVITKLGAGSRDHKQMDQEIEMRTGGLHCNNFLCESVDSLDEYETGIVLHSYCLERNLHHMLNLWSDILNHINYDEDEHLSQMIKMMASDGAENLSEEGDSFALIRAASTLKKSGAFRELCSGITHIVFLKKLAEKNDITDLKKKLIALGELVFRRDSMRLSINAEPVTVNSTLAKLENFVGKLRPGKASGIVKSDHAEFSAKSEHLKEHFIFPFNTNYVAKSILTVPYNHPDHAKLKILTALLASKYVTEEVREKGGAYGGEVCINKGGILSFYSYHDPNIKRTVDIFDASLEWVNGEGNISQQALDEAKLSIFQSVDKPIKPGSQGKRQFLDGVSDEIFSQYRLRLLDVTLDDIFNVAEAYLGGDLPHRYVSIGPKNEEITKESGWHVITKSDKYLQII